MHPTVFEAFDRICRTEGAHGRILEIGATPDANTLLRLPALAAADFRIGLDLVHAGQYSDFEIIAGNANAMTLFVDGEFDVVLSNSVLEHDPRFWLTLKEIRRVAKPSALVVLAVPGYGRMLRRSRWMRLCRLPLLRHVLHTHADSVEAATPTLGLHHYPGDYYRFSEQALRDVLLEGLTAIRTMSVLSPPRFIGWGRRLAGAP
jgi:SAM-dependent methyltransferase